MKMTLNFKMFLKVDFIFISSGATFASGTSRVRLRTNPGKVLGISPFHSYLRGFSAWHRACYETVRCGDLDIRYPLRFSSAAPQTRYGGCPYSGARYRRHDRDFQRRQRRTRRDRGRAARGHYAPRLLCAIGPSSRRHWPLWRHELYRPPAHRFSASSTPYSPRPWPSRAWSLRSSSSLRYRP